MRYRSWLGRGTSCHPCEEPLTGEPRPDLGDVLAARSAVHQLLADAFEAELRLHPQRDVVADEHARIYGVNRRRGEEVYNAGAGGLGHVPVAPVGPADPVAEDLAGLDGADQGILAGDHQVTGLAG